MAFVPGVGIKQEEVLSAALRAHIMIRGKKSEAVVITQIHTTESIELSTEMIEAFDVRSGRKYPPGHIPVKGASGVAELEIV